jgi:FG-GAP-like repeat
MHQSPGPMSRLLAPGRPAGDDNALRARSRTQCIVIAGLVLLMSGCSSNDNTGLRPTSSSSAGTGGISSTTIVSFNRIVIDNAPDGAVVEKALADLTGDGKLDAIVGEERSPSQPHGGGIFWYEYPASGRPSDHWNKHTILSLPGGSAYEDMAVADINGDGRPDVVADVNGSIYWFGNPGTSGGAWTKNLIGTLTPSGSASGDDEGPMVLGDVEGNGKVDVVTSQAIYFPDTPTRWTKTQIGASNRGAALLDIGSGHGRINLVTTDANFNIAWYETPREHGGNPRTDPWIPHEVGPASASGDYSDTVNTGDFNSDGRMDIVRADAETPSGGLSWYEAPPDRTRAWIPHSIDPGYQYAHKIQVADIDGNGTLDLVTAEQDQSGQRRVSVFFNDGHGNFTQQVLSHGAGQNVVVGDINGDGRPDIFNSAHGYYGGPHPLEIYLNEPR